MLMFIKRKDCWTHEQFRREFERTHAAMAKKFCGHLFLEYRRNYVDQVYTGGDSREEGYADAVLAGAEMDQRESGFGAREWDWDLISEWILPSEWHYQQVIRIMEMPGVAELFEEDEDRLFDRKSIVMVPCHVVDSGTRPDE